MEDALEEVEGLLDEGDFLPDDEALAKYQAAWVALPEPKGEQEPAVQILARIANAHFHLGAWEECVAAVQHAFRCGASVGDLFLRLRLGQALYELGDEREAANWLVPAYLSGGLGLFADDDPKYLEFFRNRLDPPPGGWPKGW
jgi:hypothetical protein